MSTLRVTNIQDTAGANSLTTEQIYNGSAKAWVNFNGTTVSPSTIRVSFNVSSVTKSATGTYTINFSTALESANNCVAGTATNNNSNAEGIISGSTTYTSTASALTNITTRGGGGTANDYQNVCIVVFR
jgi:hypothetical protein